MQALAREHDAGVDEFLVELTHCGEQLFARHHAGFGLLRGLDDDHEAHVNSPVWWMEAGAFAAFFGYSSVRRARRRKIDSLGIDFFFSADERFQLRHLDEFHSAMKPKAALACRGGR